MRPVGIITNPVSGRDVRRLAARARTSTPEDKRNQVARAVIGAAAAGAKRILLVREPFRIAQAAVENLRIDAEIEVFDLGARVDASDTVRATQKLRDEGCGALVVFGGDGTQRIVARTWGDVPLVPVSTGTNNVFPSMLEATTAGAAAGLIASGGVALADAARPAKVLRLEADGARDLALVDVVLLARDRVGNLMPFDPARLLDVVLTRAEPAAIGMSPIGGLLLPASADDDFGVHVRCAEPERAERRLLAPLSQGLYREVGVRDVARLELGASLELRGPGVLAFDGDRERRLADGETARVTLLRDGPRVIDVPRALASAAAQGRFLNRAAWRDAFDASR